MAELKISLMTPASAYTGANEFYELVQGGNTVQGSHDLLKDYLDTLYAPVSATITAPVAWTPTFTGFGTVSSVTAYSWRVGSELFFEVTFTSGTTSGTEARINLGYAGLDGAVTTASTYPTLSIIGVAAATTNDRSLYVLNEASKTYIVFGKSDAAGTSGLAKLNSNGIGSSGMVVSIKGSVRIQGW